MSTVTTVERGHNLPPLNATPATTSKDASGADAAGPLEDISPAAWVWIKVSLGFVAFYLVAVSLYLWWGIHGYQNCLPLFR